METLARIDDRLDVGVGVGASMVDRQKEKYYGLSITLSRHILWYLIKSDR